MDTPAPQTERQSLADEFRHSLALLVGALGLMGTLAMTLLFLTTRFGS